MTIARHVTRPMLASIFIAGGIDTLRNPGPRAELAADVATATADALPIQLPDDPEALVKIDAVAKVAGGAMLASGGRTARIGALICAASLVPTTLAGHRFWTVDDPTEKAAQRVHFTKNLSLLGGLLIAALDTGGRPSVPWRAKRRAAKLHDRVGDLRSHEPARPAVADKLAGLGEDLTSRAGTVAHAVATRVADSDLPGQVSDRAGEASHRIVELGSQLGDGVRRAATTRS